MQKKFSEDMLKLRSIEKLKIEYIEEDDGSSTIQIEWNNADPDLQWWDDLGEEGQKTFILDALQQALDCYVD